MNVTDTHTCPQCGHRRWGTDRFCAGCGRALDGAATTPADFVELQPLDETAAVKKSEPNKILRLGLLFLGVTIALGIGLSALTGASDSADNETSSQDSDAAAPTEDTPTEETLTEETLAEETPTAAPTPRATATPRIAPTPGISSAEAHDAEPESTFDEVSGYLVFTNSSVGGPRSMYVSLPDGEVAFVDRVFTDTRSAVTELGAAFPDTNTGMGWTLKTWEGESVGFELQPDEAVAFIAEDPDAGVLLGIVDAEDSVTFGLPEIEMLHPGTGERRPVLLSSDILLPNLHLIAGPRSTTAAFLMVNAGDGAYRWTWESGWTELMSGFIDAANPNWVLSSKCASPADCERHLLSAVTGEVAADVPTDWVSSWSQSISPSGRYLVTFAVADQAPMLKVLDLEEERTTELETFGQIIVWVGEHHLVAREFGPSPKTELIDVRTMESVELEAAGVGASFDSVHWIPQRPELSDS